MYPSDYGYATTPDYWTTNLYDYNTAAYSKDWLFLGSDEWLLSPHSSDFHDAWFVISSGNVTKGYGVTGTCAVCFPFILGKLCWGGDGTSSSPLRIN